MALKTPEFYYFQQKLAKPKGDLNFQKKSQVLWAMATLEHLTVTTNFKKIRLRRPKIDNKTVTNTLKTTNGPRLTLKIMNLALKT